MPTKKQTFITIECRQPASDPIARVVKSEKTGKRGILMPDNTVIPIELGAMLGGKDAYVRNIQLQCETCKGWFTLTCMGERGEECEDCIELELLAEMDEVPE